MEINYFVTVCEQLAFGIPFCGKSPQLGLFDYSQKKKYNPSQILEDVGISHFLLAKFHQKVKLKI